MIWEVYVISLMSIIMKKFLVYKILELQKHVFTAQSIQVIHLWKNQTVSVKFNIESLPYIFCIYLILIKYKTKFTTVWIWKFCV